MAILFAGGEFESFLTAGGQRAAGAAFEWSTLAGTFDSDYARGSIRLHRNGALQGKFAASLEGWFHFSFYHTDPTDPDFDNWMLSLFDTANNRAGLRLDTDGGTNIDFKRWNGASYSDIVALTVGGGNDIEANTLYRMDIHWKIQDAGGIFEIFIDGISKGSFSGDTNVTDFATVDAFELRTGVRDAVQTMYISEVIVADEETTQMRLATLGATANGTTNNAWTNGEPEIDTVGEVDDLTLIRSGTANQIQEFVTADVSAGAESNTGDVVGVVVAAKGMVGSSTITNMQATARTGGTDNVTANLTVNADAPEPIQGVFDNNPDTAAPWTISEVNAAEFGLKSIA